MFFARTCNQRCSSSIDDSMTRQTIRSFLLFFLSITTISYPSTAFLTPLPSTNPRKSTVLRTSSSSNDNLKTYYSLGSFDSTAAQTILNTLLYPESELADRQKIGHDTLQLSRNEQLALNDPRLYRTYGEFPLPSFDLLLDRATTVLLNLRLEQRESEPIDTEEYYRTVKTQERNPPSEEELWNTAASQKRMKFVDLGSGCGRLVAYAALTQERWDAHGIEISKELHDVGLDAMRRGVDEGLFGVAEPDLDLEKISNAGMTLHCGDACDCADVLRDADLIFAYGTAWPAPTFSEEVGAMVLGPEWSALLAAECPEGCVVASTDRILNPDDGWVVLERMDVENRDLLGSTGFIQVLRKKD